MLSCLSKNTRALRRLIAAFAALMILLLSGCDAVKSIIPGQEASKGLTGEALYTQLYYSINNPEDYYDKLEGEFSFTARILSEPFEQQFDEDPDTYLYQAAEISRNSDNYFFLNVTDIKDCPKEGDVVIITGVSDGFVYGTQDNKQITLLDIKASKIAPLAAWEGEISTAPEVSVSTLYYSGEFVFYGAHFAQGSFDRKIIVAYFDFKNTSKDDIAPLLDQLYFFQGDALLDSGVVTAKPVDPNALPANLLGIIQKTYVGKTQLYFVAFEVSADAGEDADNFYVCAWDDDFNQTLEIKIPVMESLEALAG